MRISDEYKDALRDFADDLNDLMADLEDIRDDMQDKLDEEEDADLRALIARADQAISDISHAADALDGDD